MQRRQFIQLTALAGVAGVPPFARGAAKRARIVIVGGGFGGSAYALAMRRLNPALDVTLVDPDDRYVTCPMSNEAIVGLCEMRTLIVTREGLRQAGVRFVRDRAVAIEGAQRRVRLDRGGTLAYDRLVVAPGIRFLWGTPEGYDEAAAERMPHAWKAGHQTGILAAQLHAMDDGGVVAISVPAGLMRCPPGPYERASLIADFLKRNKPHSKVLIFDANNRFPRQDIFETAWKALYPGLIEWIPVVEGGAVLRVDARASTLHTDRGAHRVAVANVIPPQAPDQIALDAGLCSGHGWCAVRPASFESESVAGVHVIGDACIADAMPKSASAALSQATQCARAIVASLEGNAAPEPDFSSVCYSLLAPGNALAIHGRFRVREGHIREADEDAQAPSTGGADEAKRSEAWYAGIRKDSFGI
ncbi:MAG: FCSD flavin-binding domain-containing protein [Rhodanobacteraceae bacterium]